MAVLIYDDDDDLWPELDFYEQVGLIEKTRDEPPAYAVIEKKTCACGTRNELAVDGDRIFCGRLDSAVGHSAYRIDRRVTREELTTVLAWLTRSAFQTFTSWIERGDFSRGLTSAKNKLFRKLPNSLPCCHAYRLAATPVYHLRHIVVSNEKKGPTLESVLISNGVDFE